MCHRLGHDAAAALLDAPVVVVDLEGERVGKKVGMGGLGANFKLGRLRKHEAVESLMKQASARFIVLSLGGLQHVLSCSLHLVSARFSTPRGPLGGRPSRRGRLYGKGNALTLSLSFVP